MSVETLRAELWAMTEPVKAAELVTIPEGDPRRPTPEGLAIRHEVPLEVVYETVDEVIDATAKPDSIFYRRWCARWGLEP